MSSSRTAAPSGPFTPLYLVPFVPSFVFFVFNTSEREFNTKSTKE